MTLLTTFVVMLVAYYLRQGDYVFGIVCLASHADSQNRESRQYGGNELLLFATCISFDL